jgi:4-diphosphocytidyl-2-C-methyl-D-erythritol kinase
MPATLERSSPCKINLLLNILGKRPDGFHELETVLQPMALFDVLRFERRAGGIQLTCSDPALPTDSNNLVHRAASEFLAQTGIRRACACIWKNEFPWPPASVVEVATPRRPCLH